VQLIGVGVSSSSILFLSFSLLLLTNNGVHCVLIIRGISIVISSVKLYYFIMMLSLCIVNNYFPITIIMGILLLL
jgi:hypothetical protein